MYVARSTCRCGPSRQEGIGLLMVALILAGAGLLAAALDSAFNGTLVVVVATVMAGMLVNSRARVPGLPVMAAWIMAPAIVLSGIAGPGPSQGIGAVFIALLLSVVARSRAVGVAATVFLALAEFVSRIT
jgi:hypothetical protein